MFGQFDLIAMIAGGAALAGWALAPAVPGAALPLGAGLLAAGVLHAVRLGRWVFWRTLAEPLVLVLHAAYAFVPLGMMLAGLALVTDAPGLASAGLHAFTAGAVGLMTLAVMTRASRGHSGQALTAPPGTQAIYLLVALAALARMGAALRPELGMTLLALAGLAWSAGFALFALLYGPMLLKKAP